MDCLRALIEGRGAADPNATNLDGHSVVHAAATGGDFWCLSLLLAAPVGARCDARNGAGMTPLDVAERAGHAGCAELIRSTLYQQQQREAAAAAAAEAARHRQRQREPSPFFYDEGSPALSSAASGPAPLQHSSIHTAAPSPDRVVPAPPSVATTAATRAHRQQPPSSPPPAAAPSLAFVAPQQEEQQRTASPAAFRSPFDVRGGSLFSAPLFGTTNAAAANSSFKESSESANQRCYAAQQGREQEGLPAFSGSRGTQPEAASRRSDSGESDTAGGAPSIVSDADVLAVGRRAAAAAATAAASVAGTSSRMAGERGGAGAPSPAMFGFSASSGGSIPAAGGASAAAGFSGAATFGDWCPYNPPAGGAHQQAGRRAAAGRSGAPPPPPPAASSAFDARSEADRAADRVRIEALYEATLVQKLAQHPPPQGIIRSERWWLLSMVRSSSRQEIPISLVIFASRICPKLNAGDRHRAGFITSARLRELPAPTCCCGGLPQVADRIWGAPVPPQLGRSFKLRDFIAARPELFRLDNIFPQRVRLRQHVLEALRGAAGAGGAA